MEFKDLKGLDKDSLLRRIEFIDDLIAKLKNQKKVIIKYLTKTEKGE